MIISGMIKKDHHIINKLSTSSIISNIPFKSFMVQQNQDHQIKK